MPYSLLCSFNTARNYCTLARETLEEHLVPFNLGFNHLDRATALSHVTTVSKTLFNVEDEDTDKMICVSDGTYIYHQKSLHHSHQRESYSPHKYRNLFKPMMIVAPDGYILDVKGPYAAKSNDASIFEDIIRAEDFSQFFSRGDIFILDRGFRSCLQTLQNKGYRYRTPEFNAPNQQLSCQVANRSRMVTKVRWIVEDVKRAFARGADLKAIFSKTINRENGLRPFDKVWPNSTLDYAYPDFRITCAIHNKFGKRFQTGQKSLECQRNAVAVALWVTIDAETLPDFPRYSEKDLFMLTLGPYQIKMVEGYYLEHASADGRFRIQVRRDPTQLAEKADQFDMDDPVLIRARIQSRHSNATKYIVLLLQKWRKNSRMLCSYSYLSLVFRMGTKTEKLPSSVFAYGYSGDP
uniref:DDE Tnp4 domain-containing protein n=1 Tax=Tetranychus urticae TaxID=32264 RepID=T1L0B2_TETUR